MEKYFNCHNHTDKGSNIRLLDCINDVEDLINKAIELGMSGIAITDHECLSSHVKANQIALKLQETNPDFKIGLGNEIYLVDTRESKQKYYHFILIAKDAIGHKCLRELSTQAWMNSYKDGMERVPLLKSELKDIYKKYKGHLIATTACIGGELGSSILKLKEAEERENLQDIDKYYEQIVNFIKYCLEIFENDFYIECAPSTQKEQIYVNKRMQSIANAFNIKMTIGTDSHYLTKEDRFVHKAYLNSKDGDREVDDFYEFTYLMTSDEARNLLKLSFEDNFINEIFNNSLEMQDKIEFYSLHKNQSITEVEVKDYPKLDCGYNEAYPNISKLYASDDIQDRYWINECAAALERLGKAEDDRYWDRLEEEARVKKIIGEKLGTNMFAYPNTLKHYIDLFWECGSTVGAGRGSSCAALNHYLLGITQLDPLEWNLPFWRLS